MIGGAGLDAAALRHILEVTRSLALPLGLDEMLGRVIGAGREALRADRGSVFLYDAATDSYAVSVATGLAGGRESVRIPGDRGIVGETGRTRQIVNVPDCYADPRFNREVDRATGYRTRCLLSVPLVGYDDALVGVLQLLNKADGVFDAQDELVAAALAAQCAVALQRVRMTEQLIEKERLERELAVAREIQLGFLPRVMPRVAGYDIAGTSRPAEETGGDTFDIAEAAGERAVLLLGDATGHGVGPALSVTQVRAMLRLALRLGADLDTTFRQINDQLEQDLPANRFVTAFLGVLDPATHRVRYHAGGQTPILHFHAAEDRFDRLEATTIPLGLLPSFVPPEPAELELAPGDILGLMTDGVYEYEDAQRAQFGLERVEALVRRHRAAPVQELTDALLADLAAFGAGHPQNDDVTILLVRRL